MSSGAEPAAGRMAERFDSGTLKAGWCRVCLPTWASAGRVLMPPGVAWAGHMAGAA